MDRAGPATHRCGTDASIFLLCARRAILYLVENLCPHRGGPLKFGSGDKACRIVCPMHSTTPTPVDRLIARAGNAAPELPRRCRRMRWHPICWREGRSRSSVANVASLFTVSALIAPICGLLLLWHLRLPALGLYLVAVGTDGIDGWLARFEGRASELRSDRSTPWWTTSFRARHRAVPLVLAARSGGRRGPSAGACCGALRSAGALSRGLSWLMTRRVLMFHFTSARLGALLLFLGLAGAAS